MRTNDTETRPPVGLVVTVHQPDERLAEMAETHLPALAAHYAALVAYCSGGTHATIRGLLRRHGAAVHVDDAPAAGIDRIGEVRRKALRAGLATGTPYLQLSLETEDGEYTTAWLYLSEKAFENTTNRLKDAFGFDGDFETAVQQVRGKPCSITVEEDEDDRGKMRLRVAWVNPPRETKPVADGFLAKLSAKALAMGLAAPSVKPAKEPF